MWRSLGAVDGRRHVAWLASVDGRPAGVGRYVTTAPGTAEIAFEVVDEHQGKGIGALLLDTVTTVAVTLGIERLQASVLESNHASRHLLAALGLDLRPVGDGLLEAEGPFELLDPARVVRPLVAGIAQALLVTASTGGRIPRPMVA